MFDIFKSKIKRLLLRMSGRFDHLTVAIKVPSKWYGNNYGGYYVCPQLLNKDSIVYSIGIGEDVSFDQDIMRRHNCKVFAFDPTPKSVEWVKSQRTTLPSSFHFFQYGLSDASGTMDFYLPKNANHISGSFVKQEHVDEQQTISVEMKTLSDIAAELHHSQIDVLKMDIEGAEYGVLDSILNSSIPIGQIMIEFHDRFFTDGKFRTAQAIKKLHDHAFEIFAISDSLEEISFINRSVVNRNIASH